jgi:hypothetical protein
LTVAGAAHAGEEPHDSQGDEAGLGVTLAVAVLTVVASSGAALAALAATFGVFWLVR